MGPFPTLVLLSVILASGLLLVYRPSFQVYTVKTWFKLGFSSRSEERHLSQSWEDGFVAGMCGDV